MLAYLDAGTGSMVVATVAAGAAGVGVAVRAGFAKLRRKPKDEPAAEEAPSTDEVDEPTA